MKRFSNIIGFDDAPFPRHHTGDVAVVGAVFAALRFDGVLIGTVQKDGMDAAGRLVAMIRESKFAQHIGLIMLQGVALAGFNVVDAPALSRNTNLPVLVVSRILPDMGAIQAALLSGNIPGGSQKWAMIQALGPMEPVNGIYVQRVGISRAQAEDVLTRFSIHSNIPEPVRTAHLIAGALTFHDRGFGESRGAP
ncbi:MAG: DUF99 family protein [Thermodesulfobacteriota bacterium]|nr:DUF99 family protein [Thermodesulfobacteriota bacterium]